MARPVGPAGGGSGVTDHTLLTNIGTNTHPQIDTHIAAAAPHAGHAASAHDHDADYSDISHNHTGTYQPLDADLTTIAGSITAAGHAILDDADAAAQRTTLGLIAGGAGDIWVEKGGDTMTGDLIVPDEAYGAGWDSDLSVPTKNAVYDKIESLVLGGGGYTDEQAMDAVGNILTDSTSINFTYDDALNTITAVAIFGSGAGTVAEGNHTHSYQPLDDQLTDFAGLTQAADKLPYFDSATTMATADFTAAGRAILDDADAAAQRTTLGLGTANSPQFTGIEVGHASDTTLTRSAAGILAVEGVTIPINSITNIHTAQQLELGHASDTTLSRSSAGILAVEGVTVPLNSITNTHTAQQLELGHASDTTLSRSSAGILAVEGVTVPLNAITNIHTAQQIELGHASDTTITRVSAGVIAVEGVNVSLSTHTHTVTDNKDIPIGDGTNLIASGVYVDIYFSHAATITGWEIMGTKYVSGTTGSITLDLWKDAKANHPPTVADTITASAKPSVSSASRNGSTTLTGWTTSVSAGDIIRINVDATATNFSLVTFSLIFTRTV